MIFFECDRCGVQESRVLLKPEQCLKIHPGWEWHGRVLVCRDCEEKYQARVLKNLEHRRPIHQNARSDDDKRTHEDEVLKE